MPEGRKKRLYITGKNVKTSSETSGCYDFLGRNGFVREKCLRACYYINSSSSLLNYTMLYVVQLYTTYSYIVYSIYSYMIYSSSRQSLKQITEIVRLHAGI